MSKAELDFYLRTPAILLSLTEAVERLTKEVASLKEEVAKLKEKGE